MEVGDLGGGHCNNLGLCDIYIFQLFIMKIFQQSHVELYSGYLSSQDSGSVLKEESMGFAEPAGAYGTSRGSNRRQLGISIWNQNCSPGLPPHTRLREPIFSKRILLGTLC